MTVEKRGRLILVYTFADVIVRGLYGYKLEFTIDGNMHECFSSLL